jgi:hypothetical protein
MNYYSLVPHSEKKLKLLLAMKETGIIIGSCNILTATTSAGTMYFGKHLKHKLNQDNK